MYSVVFSSWDYDTPPPPRKKGAKAQCAWLLFHRVLSAGLHWFLNAWEGIFRLLASLGSGVAFSTAFQCHLDCFKMVIWCHAVVVNVGLLVVLVGNLKKN